MENGLSFDHNNNATTPEVHENDEESKQNSESNMKEEPELIDIRVGGAEITPMEISPASSSFNIFNQVHRNWIPNNCALNNSGVGSSSIVNSH